MTFLKKHYPLILILTLATALRVNLLFIRGTWWFDEMFSVHYSILPLKEAIKYWLLETNPFLYNVFLRGYISVFGSGETMVRIPSVIFALLTIAMVYYMAQKWISKRTAATASLIITLSGVHLFISVEARTYALFVLLTTISFYWFIKIFVDQKTSHATWVLYFLTQLLLLYSHLTALTVIIIQTLALVYFKDANKITRKNFLWTQTLALFLWCFWFIPTLLPKLNPRSFSGWFFTYEHSGSNILNTINTLFINANISEFVFTLFAVILLSIFLYLFKIFPQEVKNKKDLLIVLLLWSFIPPLLGAFLGQYVTKYFVFSLPGFAFLIAYVINKITDKTAHLAILVLFFAMLIPSTFAIATSPIFSWYTITKYIEKNETNKSAILVIPFNEELVIKKYFKGKSSVEGVYPMKDNLKLEERIVRYNWQTLLSSDKEYEEWMVEHTKDHDKIFFLQYDGYESTSVIWFINRGWKFNKNVRAEGHIGINMYEFYAPPYNPTTPTSSQTKN